MPEWGPGAVSYTHLDVYKRQELPLTVVTPEAEYEILDQEDRVIGHVRLTLTGSGPEHR